MSLAITRPAEKTPTWPPRNPVVKFTCADYLATAENERYKLLDGDDGSRTVGALELDLGDVFSS